MIISTFSRGSAPARPIAPNPDTASFLDDLFAGQAGWLCLGFIDGDPLIEDMQEEWYTWPRQRDDAIINCALHVEQDHDIYVRLCLFTKRSGSYKNAKPSPWIWQDEAKIDTPCTKLIETSEGNYQALIKLDRPATAVERKALMSAWRDSREGTDDCSADAVHHIRVPGGHNHKRHGDWTVRYIVQSERVYSADKLLARCRPQGGGNTDYPRGMLRSTVGACPTGSTTLTGF